MQPAAAAVSHAADVRPAMWTSMHCWSLLHAALTRSNTSCSACMTTALHVAAVVPNMASFVAIAD